MRSFRRPAWKKVIDSIGWGALIFCLAAVLPLMADAAGTNAAPASPPPAAADSQDFRQFVFDHQDDLGSLVTKYNNELGRELAVLAIALFGKIVSLALLACWALDVILSRCFSAFFAPAYARLKRALLYASGQLALCVVVMALAGPLIFLAFTVSNFGAVFLVLAFLVILAALVGQIWWVLYLYRLGPITSAVFYLALIAVHSVTLVVVASPVLGGRVPQPWLEFVDRSLTSRLQTEIDAAKHDLADSVRSRDEVKSQVADAQNRIAQAAARQQELQKEIEEKKNSETYLFSQIVKVRVKGDLTVAHDQLNDFIGKFSNGNLIDAAKAQLAGINNDIATQAAQKKQADADAAVAAAKARADLLDHAGKGQATLSEMRQALLGKTPAQVTELFGPPIETASNRWGYAQRMIVNPLTNEKFGLAIYFTEGTVQGVDYYYGTGPK